LIIKKLTYRHAFVGCVRKTNIMKTIKIAIISILTSTSLIACSGEEEKEEAKESAPVIVQPATPSTESSDEDGKTKLNIDRENNSIGFENENFDIDLKGEKDKK
jgi:hypothetical protein